MAGAAIGLGTGTDVTNHGGRFTNVCSVIILLSDERGSRIVSTTGAEEADVMATSSSDSTTQEVKPATTRKPAARSTAGSSRTRSQATTSTQPKTHVQQVQELAERAVLVPVGAGLLARDNLVSTAKGIATRYSTRANLERELKRFERRGATARNRLERRVRRTRTRVERELRQRRSSVQRTVKQNRRRIEREVRSVREDLGRQSDAVSARFEKLVANAQELLSSAP